ncbi:MAG: type II toxin-antitoxin system VapC family toxin [Candidatus Brocadiae bacterium]|nr:type II toxin-antitoxin system VapC family toxin [Candidatus Brocadiia bacterium]
MSIKQIVIDASAALKWRLRDEEATEQADAILNDFLNKRLILIVPTLFDYEITNALKVAASMNRISKEDALSAIADF